MNYFNRLTHNACVAANISTYKHDFNPALKSGYKSNQDKF